MSKGAVVTAFLWVLLAVIVGSITVGGLALLNRKGLGMRERHCTELGERLGYETDLIGGHCYIKVRPGLKVREDQVLDFLPVIDCR